MVWGYSIRKSFAMISSWKFRCFFFSFFKQKIAFRFVAGMKSYVFAVGMYRTLNANRSAQHSRHIFSYFRSLNLLLFLLLFFCWFKVAAVFLPYIMNAKPTIQEQTIGCQLLTCYGDAAAPVWPHCERCYMWLVGTYMMQANSIVDTTHTYQLIKSNGIESNRMILYFFLLRCMVSDMMV